MKQVFHLGHLLNTKTINYNIIYIQSCQSSLSLAYFPRDSIRKSASCGYSPPNLLFEMIEREGERFRQVYGWKIFQPWLSTSQPVSSRGVSSKVRFLPSPVQFIPSSIHSSSAYVSYSKEAFFPLAVHSTRAMIVKEKLDERNYRGIVIFLFSTTLSRDRVSKRGGGWIDELKRK